MINEGLPSSEDVGKETIRLFLRNHDLPIWPPSWALLKKYKRLEVMSGNDLNNLPI